LAVATTDDQTHSIPLATGESLQVELDSESRRIPNFSPQPSDLLESFDRFSLRPPSFTSKPVSSITVTHVLKTLVLLALLSLIFGRASRAVSKDQPTLEQENTLLPHFNNSKISDPLHPVYGHKMRYSCADVHKQAKLRRSKSSFPIVLYDDVTRQHYSFMISVPFPGVDDGYT
jgi:hypothetical protein